ncbi:MAG: AAA family ATPase [Oligoflexia bacterium]|nr:AAA family ATPase [Oligoflexia bacterium]
MGKTTLAQQQGDRYFTFDLKANQNLALADSSGFLEANKSHPLILDECQLVPDLFPAIKEQVRLTQAPGQFLLTGSVRFSSRKAIRESLTGRIISFELLPMDLSEAEGRPLPDAIPRLLAAKTTELDLEVHRRPAGGKENPLTSRPPCGPRGSRFPLFASS